MFVTGIGVSTQWTLAPYLLILVSGAALLGLFSTRRIPHTLGPWLFAGLLAASLGAGRNMLNTVDRASDPLVMRHGQHVVLEGLISDEPDVRDRYVNLRLQVQRAIADNADIPLDTSPGASFSVGWAAPLVQIRAPRSQPWHYGDQIRVFGEIDAPPVLAEFSYRDYLARKGVLSWMPKPDRTDLLAQDKGEWAFAQLLRAKDALRLSSQRVMPAPESALLNGILIGDDNEIPPAIVAAFRTTGTSHIVSISGFNVSIVIALVVQMLGRIFNKRHVALIAIPAIVVYMLLTGASASVVRASVMAMLSLIGQLLWRRGFTLNTLCAAAFVMLAIDPDTLFDGGFQLSFMATLGLVLYADRLTQATQRLLTRLVTLVRAERLSGFMADVVLVTLSAQITTLPLLLANFRQLSIISLLANAIVLPLQPAAMILGMLGSAVGVFTPAIGYWVALPAYALLTATLRVVEGLAQVPGAAVPIYSFGGLHLAAYYIALSIFTLWLSVPQAARQIMQRSLRLRLRAGTVLMALTIAAIIGGVYVYQHPDGQLHVVFAGNGAFIQTPAGQQIVIGGGNGVLSVMGRAMPIWDRQIELLIQPERDDRTRGDMLPMLQRYQTERLLLPEGADEPSAMLTQWQTGLVSNPNLRDIPISVGVPMQIEPHLILTVTAHETGRLSIQLGYDALVFDLPSAVPPQTFSPAPNSILLLDPRTPPWNALKKAQPRWVIWSDRAVAPRMSGPISNHSVSLRDVGSLEMVTDGQRLTVMQH